MWPHGHSLLENWYLILHMKRVVFGSLLIKHCSRCELNAGRSLPKKLSSHPFMQLWYCSRTLQLLIRSLQSATQTLPFAWHASSQSPPRSPATGSNPAEGGRGSKTTSWSLNFLFPYLPKRCPYPSRSGHSPQKSPQSTRGATRRDRTDCARAPHAYGTAFAAGLKAQAKTGPSEDGHM